MRKTPWVDLFFSGSELNEPVKEAKEEVLKGVCIQQQQLGGWVVVRLYLRVLRKVCWPGVLVLVAPSEKVLVAAPQMVGHGAGAAPSSQQQIHFCCQTPNTLLFAKFEIHF